MRKFIPLIFIAALTAGCDNPNRFWAIVEALAADVGAGRGNSVQPEPGGTEGAANSDGTSPGTTGGTSPDTGTGTGGSPGLSG